MTSPITVAIVGLGYWGPNLARNFAAIPGCAVTWLCDADEPARDRVSRTLPAAQTTADAANSVVGYTVAGGNYGNLAAALKSAAAAKRDALLAAEQARQVAIDVARDALRTSGDTAPA